MRKSYEIVVLGGGFGGVRAAKDLARWGEKTGRNIHVTLVDKSHYHTFTPLLYEATTAHVPEVFGTHEYAFQEIRSAAAYPLEELFFENLNVSVLLGEAKGIDFKKKQVGLKGGKSLEFDFLVVAVGSNTNYFGIEGLEKNSYSLKSVFDALSLRNAIDEAAFNVPKRKHIRVAIGGGGFTGCEVAAELSGYFKKLSELHGRPNGSFECVIVEASNRILGGAGDWVREKAQKRLAKLGVKIMFNKRIKSVRERELIFADKTAFGFDILLWTAGVKANDLAHEIQKVDPKKKFCLTADPYLQIKSRKGTFSAGDITYCVDESTGECLPMTAWVAIQEGKSAAKNIERLIEGKPMQKYKPGHAGFIIPLGGRWALLDAYGIKMAGFLPWLIKQAVELNYWRHLVGFRKAWKILRAGVKIFTKND